MKKTLIALAALAATGAFAQSSVTISGTLDAAVRSTSTTYAGGTVNNTAIGQNGYGTSGVIFSGVEDLGGGLKAVFLYEMDPLIGTSNNNHTGPATATGPIQGGQIYVGLNGGFGSIKLGVPNAPSLTTQGSRSPFGTKDGGRAGVTGGLMGPSVTRLDNSINYTSPNMSGFSFGVSYTPGTSANPYPTTAVAEDSSMTDAGLFYANGPLSLGVSQYSRSSSVTNANSVTNTTWFASYNFKVAKATLGGHNYTESATKQSTGLSLGLEVPLSAAMALHYSYQRLDDTSATNSDSQMNAIGINYALSKRSSVYARYGYQTTDNVAATAAEKGSVTMVGLRHNF